jgi:hypothetical protein
MADAKPKGRSRQEPRARGPAGLDPVDRAAAPVGYEEAATVVDEQRQRVREAGREHAHTLRRPVRAELQAHDPPSEMRVQVLAPLGDEEVPPVGPRERAAGVERDPVRGRVRFEVGRGPGHAPAAPAQAQRPRVRPATGSCWWRPNGRPLTTTRRPTRRLPRRVSRSRRPCSETNSVWPRQAGRLQPGRRARPWPR